MIDTFDVISGGGVQIPAAIPGGTAIQSPWIFMGNAEFVDVLIRLENGAGEPTLAFEQSTDAVGTTVLPLPICEVRVAASADVTADQPWVQDESINRSNEPLTETYTPDGDYATDSLEALIQVRVHNELFTGGNRWFRLNSAAVAGRDAIVVAICKDAKRKGKLDASLIA